jgi:predicted nucleotidyltransferase
VRSAELVPLPSGTSIRVIPAPVFVATKLEAFHGRGAGDYLFSHDLGDILSVVDGRDSLIDECRHVPAELRAYLSEQISALLRERRFVDALPGHLPSDSAGQSRLPDLELKLRRIADLEKP